MTASLFLIFVALMATAVVAGVARYVNRRVALGVMAGLLTWLVYVGAVAYLGLARNTAMRPPGIAFIVGPVLLFLLVFVVRWSADDRVALAVPLWLVLGAQSFRIGVELFLHQLWIAGLAPRMLTFDGANVDVYIGATAPLVAWLSTRGPTGLRLSLVWNAAGLLSLANVVGRAVLTAPGPLNLIHAEVPNLLFGTFPYVYIPGFFVPLAVVLHGLGLRAARRRSRPAAGTVAPV
jgi:hypothetical protein